MAASIEKLSEALIQTSDQWKWELSFAPKPGQQRIKIVAHKIGVPAICRTFIFAEELCKTLPLAELVRHIISLLPTGVEEQNYPRRVPCDGIGRIVKTETPTLHSQYREMRKSYAMNVADLKDKAVPIRAHSWSNIFTKSIRQLPLVRK